MANSQLLREACARSIRYLEELRERRVFPDASARDALRALDTPLPERPSDPHEALKLLDEMGSPATVATAGSRYFGYVVGGSLDACVAANWLTTAWDQNASMVSLSPAACAIEKVAARWLLDVLGLPKDAHCSFQTGTTTAHMTALVAARNAVLRRVGWDVRADGLSGAPSIHIVVGGEAHPSLMRALGVVGFGARQVTSVRVDDQGRMLPEAISEFGEHPTIVCAQVGNVNTGASDPIAAIRDAAPGAWLHVDGAFGLWANASPRRRHFTKGIEHADSWATDGHKWLNVPYDSGIAIVREGAAVKHALSMSAAYLTDERSDPKDYTLELSRRARGIDVWMALRTLGRQGIADLVDRCCDLAKRFAERLGALGYSVLNDVVLNQVLVTFGSAEQTHRVIEALQSDGVCWCGGTVWQGQVAMRISVSSWATTVADVDRCVDTMARIARPD